MTLPVPLTDALRELILATATCYIATSMPDGSPQLTLTWVDTDGRNVLVNSVIGHQKVRNIERDPRVALAVSSPTEPASYAQLRGRVTSMATEGAVEHIEMLSQRYTGGPYPWYGGREQQRVLLTVEVDRISGIGY